MKAEETVCPFYLRFLGVKLFKLQRLNSCGRVDGLEYDWNVLINGHGMFCDDTVLCQNLHTMFGNFLLRRLKG